MTDFKPGDRVKTPVGQPGRIARLERKHGQDGAHLNVRNDFGEPSPYTRWYPLRAITKVDDDGQ